ncbi:MAG: hypothetical protein QOJ06_2476 [Pseudonocardiales bacterium]|jgi:hypothetical protein|nr:hypothetical protein [Pseudonocardiales bacterium]
MSDAVSFAEVSRQHVELLPARTVLSMFLKVDDPSTGGDGATESGGGLLSKLYGAAMALAVPKSL